MLKTIELIEGSGGKQSNDLVAGVRGALTYKGLWRQCLDDGAVLPLGKNSLVFTTDSYTVDPVFFPGGNIGKLSICGTVNDLSVMGADVLGISLGIILEEGFPKGDLNMIMASMEDISCKYNIPVVTGDTKVMPAGKLDKIVINTSGIGLAEHVIPQTGVSVGDYVICSGSLGDHAGALLAQRFDYETDLVTDCCPLIHELSEVRNFLTAAKDPTRGGIASVLNEIAVNNNLGFVLEENQIPVKESVNSICELLGLNPYELAGEGRFVGCVRPENKDKVLDILKKYNSQAAIIGRAEKTDGVWIQTLIGKKRLEIPQGRLVPRIC